jgi:hypothetical protein
MVSLEVVLLDGSTCHHPYLERDRKGHLVSMVWLVALPLHTVSVAEAASIFSARNPHSPSARGCAAVFAFFLLKPIVFSLLSNVALLPITNLHDDIYE